MLDPRRARNDRPIDRIRNAGGRARIEGDGGPTLTMFNLREERMYFISERAVASAQMADQIDPDRNNPTIPQVVQTLELAYGATTPFIQRTLCVATELFQRTYLPDIVGRDDALQIALEAAQLLTGVQDHINILSNHAADLKRRMDAGEQRMNIVPRAPALNQRIRGSIADFHKFALLCQKLADLFYPRAHNTKWTDHLRGTLTAQLTADDVAWPALNWAFDAIRKILNYRNAMIHVDDGDKRLIIRDYELNADGKLIAPTVEIIHPCTPQPRVDALILLSGWIEELSHLFEAYAVIFCDRNARQWAVGIKSRVAKTDQDRRTGTRFYWHGEFLPGFPKPEPEVQP